MSRRLVPALAAGIGIAALVAPAAAAPKAVEKSFTVNIPVPFSGATSDPLAPVACAGAPLPMSTHLETVKIAGPGTLKVEVTGFLGDWDIALQDGKGKRLAEGDNASVTPTNMSTGSVVEKLVYKAKKAGDVQIIVCNFLGGPTGKGKYVFTPGKK
ncbi:MAG TPA: hypothetical protein VNB94_05340 [Mycobacteriales bacterium]|nr:hypothetical protein [Mycobacteriales bacterium]